LNPPVFRIRVVLPCPPAGQRPWALLLDHLCERFAHVARAEWVRRFSHGLLTDAHGQALDMHQPFVPGMTVYCQREVPDETPIHAVEHVVYEDSRIVVADKPHFLPVVPGGRYLLHTLQARLQQRLGLTELQPAHRIDRDTAGLVLFIKQRQHRNAYQQLFRDRIIHKVYEAIAPNLPDQSFPLERHSRLVRGAHFMQATESPGEVNASTRIDRMEVCGPWARYRLEPLSGQRHQLRVHLAAMGAPIAFDPIYPELLPQPDNAATREPLRLLARELAFTDPVSGTRLCFVSNRSLTFPIGP
jgi:tRNA pseudouridine32 synthase / 23S rRNA pseudouridine746 synthase